MLGALTAYLGWKWGEIFQSKIFLTLLSLFLFICGIATLLHWSFTLPQFVYNVPMHRYAGAFLTGVLAGILSAPCSGPFLGSVLAYTLTQPPLVVITLFGAIGTGLAFPYVLILILPKLLRYLPKGGRIGVQVESILAFLLIGGALFFAQAILPESIHIPLWWGIGVAVLGWAAIAIIQGQKITDRVVPLITIVTVLFISKAALTIHDDAHLDWQPYSAADLEYARLSGRPALIEFTADWCINCKFLEQTVYSSPAVIESAIKVNLVPFKVDMTEFNEEHKTLIERYGGTAIPYAVLISKQGKVTQTFSGMFTSESMKGAILGVDRSAGSKTYTPGSIRE
jgi:thiol:disulfide interchange protein